MTRKDKLITRFLNLPNDFHYNELVTLLVHYGFQEVKAGKTSGSRVNFINQKGIVIIMHKPHTTGILKLYQLRQVKEILEL